MAFFNYVTKEITLKVVYYGPGLSGKTTNLQHLYSILDASSRGKFISLSTESDRTLFFDFLPVELGKIRDFSVRFQLYTVPGQIRYNATRKLVLKGADAVVFVADSQRDMRDQNIESFMNMRENLLSNNLDPDTIPVVLQYNKRDLPALLSLDELADDLNKADYQSIEAVAVKGDGVQETFRLVTKLLLKDIVQKHKVDIVPSKDEGITVKIPEKDQFETGETVVPGSPVAVEAVTPRNVPQAKEEKPAPARPAPLGVGAPLYDEELASLASSLNEVSQSLSGIKETLSVLYRETKESGRQHMDALRILKEISASLAENKKKRRWFHFFSR
ncbi:MAG TPA: ADP-ribosylation factor-like protein [Thermodesulfovibrionales bacterium]|nr:ADP-ribosylation factor-like protein [Thermodesulfovibrionales bacterium]